jgi:hypothetical protein
MILVLQGHQFCPANLSGRKGLAGSKHANKIINCANGTRRTF